MDPSFFRTFYSQMKMKTQQSWLWLHSPASSWLQVCVWAWARVSWVSNREYVCVCVWCVHKFEVMQSLSLNDLGQSAHPLLEPGDFSIFSDPNVSHITMVALVRFGWCLSSHQVSLSLFSLHHINSNWKLQRSLSAFNFNGKCIPAQKDLFWFI